MAIKIEGAVDFSEGNRAFRSLAKAIRESTRSSRNMTRSIQALNKQIAALARSHRSEAKALRDCVTTQKEYNQELKTTNKLIDGSHGGGGGGKNRVVPVRPWSNRRVTPGPPPVGGMPPPIGGGGPGGPGIAARIFRAYISALTPTGGLYPVTFARRLFGRQGIGNALEGAKNLAGSSLGMVLMGVSAGLVALAGAAAVAVKITQAGAANIKAMTADYLAGGFTTRIGSIGAIGGMLGMPGGQAANQLGEGIRSGIAAGFAASMGINIHGGPFGSINYNEKLLKAVNNIANSNSIDIARRKAMALGMPDLAMFQLLGARSKGQLTSMYRATNPAHANVGVEFSFQMQRFSEILKDISSTFASPMMMSAIMGMDMFSTVAKVFFGGFANMINGMTAPLQLIYFLTRGFTPKDSAQKRHTKAMEDHTRAMNESREIIGGAGRANGSVPSGWRHQGFDQAIGPNGAIVPLGVL